MTERRPSPPTPPPSAPASGESTQESGDGAGFAAAIDIAAPPEVVFAHLVTVEGMLAWMGQHAVLDPTPGGEFSIDISGAPVRGHYLLVDPPRRVVVSWGIAGSDELPPGHSQVSFTLTPLGSGTRLTLQHTGLPIAWLPGHQKGWAHFLDRLQQASAGRDPGPDAWLPPAPESSGPRPRH